MDQISLYITGTAPLLMHNNVTVNPLDERTKAIKKYTSKRTKTEEDIRTVQRLEWEAGLYFDDEVGPYIPGINVKTMLRDSAKLTRQGTSVTRAVVVSEPRLLLEYPQRNGSVTPDQLWQFGLKDYRVVGQQANSIMRCRPMFPTWSLNVPILSEPSIIDADDLKQIAIRAGLMIGLGDYRPRFGRFKVTSFDVIHNVILDNEVA